MGISILIGNFIGRTTKKIKDIITGTYLTTDNKDYCTRDGSYYILKSSSVFDRGYWDFNGIWNNNDVFKF